MHNKKLLSLALAGILIFSLTACTPAEVPPVESSSSEVIEVSESEEVSEPESEAVEEGATDAGLVDGTNIIDDVFNEGEESPWLAYQNGGVFELVPENGELVVKITESGSVNHAVQAYRDGFALNQGCVYDVSFDIRSDVERDYEWRIQMNGGSYSPYYVEDPAHLTTETQHVSATFTMNAASDPSPRFAFNLGAQGDFDSKTVHNVYIDNIKLTIADASNALAIVPLPEPNKVNLNQIGYKPDSVKTFVSVYKQETSFSIVDFNTNETVYTGTLPDDYMSSRGAGCSVYHGDFSDFTTPGTYYVHLDVAGDSYPFTIAEDVYDDVYASTLKMLYLQRCGCELDAKYAEAFAHPACHTAEATIFGTSETIDVSGGWHDAGDYGRYIVAGAKTVQDLLLAYEGASVDSDDIGIPESGNGIPDVLDEARYELDWMLKMQAQNGGVYHKVTCAVFPETVMPQDETAELIVCPISTTATGDFAAVMAKASVVYRDIDASFADTCLAAAKNAYDYLKKNAAGDQTGFLNPSEITTGEYPDANNTDEFFWASIELYNATGEDAYLKQAKKLYTADLPLALGWADVAGYGVFAYLNSDSSLQTDSDFSKLLKESLLTQADANIELANKDGYFSSLERTYPWGSNMTIANNGMIYDMAYRVSGDEKYLQMENYQSDYLLGMNSLGYCFVTGFGTLYPTAPHHRPSESVGSAVPGMLVGGADNALEDPYALAVLSDAAPAKCYVDNASSFSTNEITIYWNSPLIYLLSVRK